MWTKNRHPGNYQLINSRSEVLPKLKLPKTHDTSGTRKPAHPMPGFRRALVLRRQQMITI